MQQRRRSSSRLGDALGYSLAALMIVGVIVGVFMYERMLWNECRSFGHSFWYCLRILGKD